TYFKWLPPAGFLSVKIPKQLNESLSQQFREQVVQHYLNLIPHTAQDKRQEALESLADSLYKDVLTKLDSVVLDKTQTYFPIDADMFFGEGNTNWLLADVETTHHLLNQSWYDPPLEMGKTNVSLYLVWDTLDSIFRYVVTQMLQDESFAKNNLPSLNT